MCAGSSPAGGTTSFGAILLQFPYFSQILAEAVHLLAPAGVLRVQVRRQPADPNSRAAGAFCCVRKFTVHGEQFIAEASERSAVSESAGVAFRHSPRLFTSHYSLTTSPLTDSALQKLQHVGLRVVALVGAGEAALGVDDGEGDLLRHVFDAKRR